MNRVEKIEKVKKSSKKIKIILIFILVLIILLAIKLGIFVANWQNLAQDMIANTPSEVFDTDGKVIAKIGSNKNTKNISLTDIPENLKDAYVSIEDQRFYKHNGVDFPRTAAAILSYIKNLGSSSFGGSSITQQLVKNITGDNSSKVSRKVNEWIKAISLEGVLEKDEILEAYLNIIYVGPNIYGVNLGAIYYFNKNVSELDLAECAFLAGINNSPNSYSPFSEQDNFEKIKTRTKTVLSKMLELKYIDENEYNNAVSEVDGGLRFKNGKIEENKENNIYSYHTDAMITEIIEDISKKKNISSNFANNYVEMAGLKIYSTQNSNIQKEIEDEVSKKKYSLKSSKDSSITSQAAMVVLDHSTGQILGCVGGIGTKTSRGFNRATQALRQTGSSGKPLSVLLPAIDKKIITPATLYNDEATIFDDGSDEGYSPTDYNEYKGEITVRSAVESSQNIPFVKIMEELTPKESIKYMKKLGISSLTEKDENLNLALGGLDKGISPLEMASAYGTIANSGTYIEPTFYIKIENSIGKTVVKSKQKSKKVFSENIAFILQSLLTQPVVGPAGTAKYCKIPGIDVCAKTGTTNEEYDRWLCGFTPYYTAVTWFGFDLNETINFNNKNPSGQIWSNVMKKIHYGLANKAFEVPEKGIVSAEICPKSGLLANSNCSNSYTEYFLEGTLPTAYCNKHSENSKSQTTSTPKEQEPIEQTEAQPQETTQDFTETPSILDNSSATSTPETNIPNVENAEQIQENTTISPTPEVTDNTSSDSDINEEDNTVVDNIFEQ